MLYSIFRYHNQGIIFLNYGEYYEKEFTVKWNNGDKAGGIAGYFVYEGKHSIENNVVKDTTITAYRDFGGLVGASNTVNYIKNNTADNITLLINNEHNYKNYNSIETHLVSGIVGRIITNGVIDPSNKATNVSISILELK